MLVHTIDKSENGVFQDISNEIHAETRKIEKNIFAVLFRFNLINNESQIS